MQKFEYHLFPCGIKETKIFWDEQIKKQRASSISQRAMPY